MTAKARTRAPADRPKMAAGRKRRNRLWVNLDDATYRALRRLARERGLYAGAVASDFVTDAVTRATARGAKR